MVKIFPTENFQIFKIRALLSMKEEDILDFRVRHRE